MGIILAAGFLVLRSTPESEHAEGISLPPRYKPVTPNAASARHSGQPVLGGGETSIALGRLDYESETTAIISSPTRSAANAVAGDSAHLRMSPSIQPSSPISREAPPGGIPSVQTGTLNSPPQDTAELMPDMPPAPQPAVMIDIDDPAVSLPDDKERLSAIASDFTDILTRSGMDPASPAYRQLWDREGIVADTRFRSMYGGHVWMNHHIQSHHAQNGAPTP